MAQPVCGFGTLTAAGGCYEASVVTIHQRRAIKLYMMALQLKAIGGTDYTNSMSTTLISDSKCRSTLSKGQMKVAEVVIEANNARNAGASIPTGSALMQAIACARNMGVNDMEAAELHLRCNLGYAKTLSTQ